MRATTPDAWTEPRQAPDLASMQQVAESRALHRTAEESHDVRHCAQ
jgi:hypothetical protein